MEYVQLGRTGVKVSPICLGCMNLGHLLEEAPSLDLIDRAIGEGINFLDTANVYQRGQNELLVGKALKRNGKRDEVFLATKVRFRGMDDGPNGEGISRYTIIKECEASLRRLQTDRIDLYYLHRPMREIPIDETLRALDDLVRSGKVRYIACSTFAGWQVVESLWVAKELGLNRFVAEQPPYNLLDRRPERELFAVTQNYGIAVNVWSPLARGFLAGKYHRGDSVPDTARLSAARNAINDHLSEAGFRVLDVVEELAKEKDATADQIAIAWVLRHPAVTTAIIGPSRLDHVLSNLKALEVELSEEDCNRLDEAAPPGSVIAPYYHLDGRPDPHRW